MKGVVKESAGVGAVWREDLPVPEIGEGDMLVKVKATAICGTDQHIYGWTPWAEKRIPIPMVFGHEFSGEVVKVGSGVRRFKVGDRVAGETHIGCGKCRQCLTGNMHICEDMKIIGVHVPGCFADYIAIPESCAWPLDDSFTWEQGALLEPMGVAMHGVSAGHVGGKDVLLIGAGPIGLAGVGIAKADGANRIIISEPVQAKLDVAKKLGADVLVQAGKDDLKTVVNQVTEGRGVDVVIDFSGFGPAIVEGLFTVAKGGRMVLAGLPDKPVTLDLTDGIIYREATVVGITGRIMWDTWFECQRILKSGKLDLTAIIGGTYELRDFDKAFAALKAGAPGKMLLIP